MTLKDRLAQRPFQPSLPVDSPEIGFGVHQGGGLTDLGEFLLAATDIPDARARFAQNHVLSG
jgi:hypothetical protein